MLIGAEGDLDEMSRAFEAHHPVGVVRKPLPDLAVEKISEQLNR